MANVALYRQCASTCLCLNSAIPKKRHVRPQRSSCLSFSLQLETRLKERRLSHSDGLMTLTASRIIQVRALAPDDMVGDVKTSQQGQELNASDNSSGIESLEGADARDGQTVQTVSNSVHWSKRLEAQRDAVETKLGGMKIKETLEVGSPVVIIEAPPMLKTAEPMPMMRPNTGTIKHGDAGRIIDRRPKDVWAVRFVIGAYLIDRRYFEPLEL
ncbi:hypothetical protein CY35_01G191000 [Sphagnum magellanicum]|nr:hypothetical protein CY35_01G191000 [Sphagnum magellanicum]KAH9576980.1 hypothetical protein CY35_01G191000 [Sphagnum magellanicum]